MRTGARVEERELPFVIGVLADLYGQGEHPARPFGERAFAEIHRGNFDDVLAAHAPRLEFPVQNVLDQGGAPLRAGLCFRSLADFEPEGVARQVPGLWDRVASGWEPALRQLASLLNAPEFQRLEASWRGLDFLVSRLTPCADVRIRVMSAHPAELSRDLERAGRPDRSFLFKRVHDDIFGTSGAAPFDLLVGDYEFAHDAPDVAFMRRISEVAAAIQAPFLAAASPRMFGCRSFAGLPSCSHLSEVLTDPEHQAWQSFRKSETGRYLVLTLPRILLRLPCGETGAAALGSRCEERVSDSDLGRYLWGNSAYVLAIKAAESFRRYGLPVAIRGIEHGFESLLPIHTFAGTDGRALHRGPTETPIDDTLNPALTLGGFTTLCGSTELGGAVFFTAPTCGLPLEDPDSPPRLWVEARMRTYLPWVMAAARFAHYLKVIVRDTGALSREACESTLNEWIARYVSAPEASGAGNETYRPLKQAHVDVRGHSATAGPYTATLFLEPQHPWLDEHTVAMRISVPLPGTAVPDADHIRGSAAGANASGQVPPLP